MSLNGLDDPKIAEAYAAASSESGGWYAFFPFLFLFFFLSAVLRIVKHQGSKEEVDVEAERKG